MRFFTDRRTRSGASLSRPSIVCTRTTMRSERSRSSRTSTKPARLTFQAVCCRIGCATRALLSVTAAKPIATAASADQQRKRDRARARERRRERARGGDAERHPPDRLAFGGEIENDAEPEADRQPRHQPPGRGVGREPARQDLARRRQARRPATRRRAAARRPKFVYVPCPAPWRISRMQPDPAKCYYRLAIGRAVNGRGTFRKISRIWQPGWRTRVRRRRAQVRNPGQVHPQARPWRVMPAGSGRRMPPGLARAARSRPHDQRAASWME